MFRESDHAGRPQGSSCTSVTTSSPTVRKVASKPARAREKTVSYFTEEEARRGKKRSKFTHRKLSSTALVKFTWSPGELLLPFLPPSHPLSTSGPEYSPAAAVPSSRRSHASRFLPFDPRVRDFYHPLLGRLCLRGPRVCLALPRRLLRSYGAVSIVRVWRQATFTNFFFFWNQSQQHVFTGVFSCQSSPLQFVTQFKTPAAELLPQTLHLLFF